MNLLPAAAANIEAPAGALVGIRPQDVQLGTSGVVRATIELVELRGADQVVHLRLDDVDTPLLAVVPGTAQTVVGTAVLVTLPADRMHFFDGSTGLRLNMRS